MLCQDDHWRNVNYGDDESDDVEYEVHLPQSVHEEMTKHQQTGETATNEATIGVTRDDANEDTKAAAAPFFEAEPSLEDVEHMIVRARKQRNVQGQNDTSTKQPPTRTCTKQIFQMQHNKDGSSRTTTLESKDVSSFAQHVATKIFSQEILSAMNNPQRCLLLESENSDEAFQKDQQTFFETASLMEILLWSHYHRRGRATLIEDGSEHSPLDWSKEEKQSRFASLCKHLVETNQELVEKGAVLLPHEFASLHQEVLASLQMQIYTFLESWEGAPIHSISAKHGGAATCLPGGNVVLPFGYGGLIQRFARPLLEQENIIRLVREVTSIRTPATSVTTEQSDDNQETQGERGRVAVRCKLPKGEIEEYSASACIVALPLGVLRDVTADKYDGQFFQPKLPAPVIRSIRSLGIAVREKIEMLFPTRWWPERIGRFQLANTYLHQSPTYNPYTTFMVESLSSSDNGNSSDTDTPNVLVCYLAGEFAKETIQKTNVQIQEECMQVLRNANLASVNDEPIPDPTAVHISRWLQDPFSRGSWTFYGKGSSPKDVQEFRANSECIDRCLFFAGEHTCEGSMVPGDDMGCVHGAWLSGELAADAVLKRLQSGKND